MPPARAATGETSCMSSLLRVGQGFDIHRFSEGRELVLGGVVIKNHPGLLGHSDADVLCHAVMDALLGAVAAGDIGVHFPDTDPAWKNASSIELLARVAGLVREHGGTPVNVDATVLAEKPRLAPYREQMCNNLASAIGLPRSAISVKATTLEGLGPLGAGEGMAAMAVAGVLLATGKGATK